jgi:hypothetical protein
MRVPPFQSTTAAATSRRASSGSERASARVTLVSRVPKQNTSTRRPARMAAKPNCIRARE